jgi:hypothetical protein
MAPWVFLKLSEFHNRYFNLGSFSANLAPDTLLTREAA